MGVLNPNSRGHTKGWVSLTPTQGVTIKCGSPSPQLEGPALVGMPQAIVWVAHRARYMKYATAYVWSSSHGFGNRACVIVSTACHASNTHSQN